MGAFNVLRSLELLRWRPIPLNVVKKMWTACITLDPIHEGRGPVRKIRLRSVVIAPFFFSSFLLAGCEEDALAPVSGFEPEDCIDITRCSEGGAKLDAGSRTGADGGLPVGDEDSGQPPVGSDGGTPIDAGFMDAGIPDSGPPPTDFLDVSGTWQTRYDFDTSEYLFGISNIADPLSFIVNIVNNNISTGFPPLDQWISSFVMMYVPPQVIQILGVLNSIATFSERMEAEGAMTIMQHPPSTPSAASTDLDAVEAWSSITVFIVEQCPLLRQDPNFPQCARYTIPVVQQPAMAGPLEIGVDVKPFSGTLDAVQNGSAVVFPDREVEVEMGRLILLVVDTIVRVSSGGQYNDLHDMLSQIIDCGGLAQDAANWAQQNLGLSPIVALGLQTLIDDQCNDAIDDIVNGVGLVTVDWDVFEYDQHGVAKDYDADNVADELQLMSVPNGLRNGTFQALISASMDGVWEGVR